MGMDYGMGTYCFIGVGGDPLHPDDSVFLTVLQIPREHHAGDRSRTKDDDNWHE